MSDDVTRVAAVDALFHEAIRRGDTSGVDACIRAMVRLDPRRAVEMYDDLSTALKVAQVLTTRSEPTP